MSAIFLFISPAVMDEQSWLTWRRAGRHGSWPPQAAGQRYGDALLVTPAAGGDVSAGSVLVGVEQAIAGSRFNSGVMCQLPRLAQDVHRTFDEGGIKGKVSVAAWALASRTDGLVVTTAVAVDLSVAELARSPDQAEARRQFDAAVFRQDTTADVTEAVAFAQAAGLPAGTVSIRRDATQLLTLIRTSHEPPDAFKQVHHAEEGDAASCAQELDLTQVLGGYLHVGYSNTTAAGSQNRALLQLAPIAIKAQAIWLAQRELRTRILAMDFERAQQGRRETTDLLLRLQEIRFELHLWDSEIEAYRRGLVPWQARILARYVAYWGMEDTFTRLASLVDHACDLLSSTAGRFDGILEARQANILAVIAIIQLIGVAGAVAGYFQLADLSRLGIDPIARSPVFAALVAALPAVTTIAILGLIAASRRGR